MTDERNTVRAERSSGSASGDSGGCPPLANDASSPVSSNSVKRKLQDHFSAIVGIIVTYQLLALLWTGIIAWGGIPSSFTVRGGILGLFDLVNPGAVYLASLPFGLLGIGAYCLGVRHEGRRRGSREA